MDRIVPDPARAEAFISYSREDSEFVLRLAKDLKAAGGQVWLDQLDIHPGHPWDLAIEGALNRAPQMLLVLTPASARSENVRDEISFALDGGKIVIPILLKDCVVPLRLQRTQRIDFRTDYAFGLAALLEQLQNVPPPVIASPSPPLLQNPPSSPPMRRSVQAALVALGILLILAIAYKLRPGPSEPLKRQPPQPVAASAPVPSATPPSPTPTSASVPALQPNAQPAKSPSSPSIHPSRPTSEAPPKVAGGPSLQTLAGSRWIFTETGSDGHEAYYDVVFSGDGTTSFQDAYGPPKYGSWKQNGSSVYIEVNHRYAERNGHFVGRRLVGKGANIRGYTWTWFGEKRSKKSVEKK